MCPLSFDASVRVGDGGGCRLRCTSGCSAGGVVRCGTPRVVHFRAAMLCPCGCPTVVACVTVALSKQRRWSVSGAFAVRRGRRCLRSADPLQTWTRVEGPPFRGSGLTACARAHGDGVLCPAPCGHGLLPLSAAVHRTPPPPTPAVALRSRRRHMGQYGGGAGHAVAGARCSPWRIPSANPRRAALEGKGPQGRPQKRSDKRLEEAAKAVGGGYCRLQMPLRLAFAARGTVAGHRLGALEGGGGVPPPLPPTHAVPPVCYRAADAVPSGKALWLGALASVEPPPPPLTKGHGAVTLCKRRRRHRPSRVWLPPQKRSSARPRPALRCPPRSAGALQRRVSTLAPRGEARCDPIPDHGDVGDDQPPHRQNGCVSRTLCPRD